MAALSVTVAPSARCPRWWAYAWWAVAGATLGLGLVSMLTVGPILVLVAALLTIVGCLSRALRNRSASALVGGLAAAPLVLRWTNRAGPGRICTVVDDTTSCAERWSPWPFVVVAACLLAVSVGLMVRSHTAPEP